MVSWIGGLYSFPISPVGTNPTCQGDLTMPLDRGRPEGTGHGQSDAIGPTEESPRLESMSVI
jgi:hypothetical protein